MLSRRHALALLAATLAAPVALAGPATPVTPPEGAARWNEAIAAFEAQDQENPPEPGAVVFVGSSSIRKWSTLSRDMAPLRVLNRGFGGSHIPHVTWFADRIVLPYRPSAIVLYAGDNDVAWGADANTVLASTRAFLERIRPSLPDVPVYFLSIKPSPLRWASWPEMARANARVKALAEETEGLTYVDVASVLLDEAGQPVASRFAADRLHLSDEGYRAWTAVVRRALSEEIRAAEAESASPPTP